MIDRFQIFVWCLMFLFMAAIVISIADAIAAAMIDGSKWFAVVMMVVIFIMGLVAFHFVYEELS